MLPFQVHLRPGESIFSQVIYAVKKALVSGRLRPGDRFPSVRKLSQELKINPNTAHKVVASLVQQELLEVRPGIGTLVAKRPPASGRERRALLADEAEHLVVEAKKLGLELSDLLAAIQGHWLRLTEGESPEDSARKVEKETV